MNEDFLLIVNSITVFNFNNMDVMIIDKKNDPWFVLIDVCKILELTNVSKAARLLDEDEKNTVGNNDGNRGNPETTIVMNNTTHVL